jgi:hypothetical protein
LIDYEDDDEDERQDARAEGAFWACQRGRGWIILKAERRDRRGKV